MLLAFGHKARQGKGTAAEAVVNYYNNKREAALLHLAVNPRISSNFDSMYPEAKLFNFADALYQVCREAYGMTEKDPTLLQSIGEGRRAEFGRDYWIKQLAPKVEAFKGIAVISDARYHHEVEYVKSNSGHTINVRRLYDDGSPFIATDRDPLFVSETQLDGYNYDHYIVSKSAALTAELAITIAEYIRGLES
jgi:hypothetical protein